MKYFSAGKRIARPRGKEQKIYLLLDYDGTLAPIAQTPDLAVLPPKTRAILKKLSRQPRCVLAIISGRTLTNIKKMVKIPRIIYSGNHGLEADYYGVRLNFFKDADFRVLLTTIDACLRAKMKGIKGVLLENKKMALAVHYRMTARSQHPAIRTIFQEVVKPYQDRRQVAVTTGKKVLEIRPPFKWGKGDFVNWLIRTAARDKDKPVIYYFGDDRTDEDVFKVLKGKGYAIIVGKKPESAAEYYLRNTAEVRRVLEQIEQDLKE